MSRHDPILHQSMIKGLQTLGRSRAEAVLELDKVHSRNRGRRIPEVMDMTQFYPMAARNGR